MKNPLTILLLLLSNFLLLSNLCFCQVRHQITSINFNCIKFPFNPNLTENGQLNKPNINSSSEASTARTIPYISTSVQIGGIINTYTPVVSLNPCENKIVVEDGSTFSINDTVLIVQMKGAIIDSSNTINFGSITNYSNAGNYEFNYVKSKAGNIIELKNALTRKYDILTGKVQLVKVPYYNSVTVASTLTCLPWDGSKGGILALNVKDTLYLNNNIDVSGKGFWGGKVINPKSNTPVCNNEDYCYSNDPRFAAPKGEGITAISASKSFGRGPLANGGGGGSGHNSGGAGGGNGALGGNGGKEWIVCNPSLENGGIGGRTLNYSNIQNKIFLGGGGGAGHCDNLPGFNPEGGNGGGILIIQANFIKTNNNFIIADGASSVECIQDGQQYKCHEGMGGGGAGGTILFKTNVILDNTIISIKGGKGADMNGERGVGQLGPGGGGSGGILWLSGNIVPGSLSILNTGGLNGVNLNYGNDIYSATSGEDGLNIFNLKITTDTVIFKKNIDSVKIKDSVTSCGNFNFKGLGFTNSDPILFWQWNFGDGGAASTQNTSHGYSLAGTYMVTLVVTDINGCTDSVVKNIISGSIANYDFTYQQDLCDPLSFQFFNVGAYSSNTYWSFGDGASSTGILNPFHTYSSAGNYIVKYINENSECTDTLSKIISVDVIYGNIIISPDTALCFGNVKQLNSLPGLLDFCWSPATNLDDIYSSNPTTTTQQNIIYYLNAKATGVNVIENGDFNAGNSGFSSEYNYANLNTTEGEYIVAKNPTSWNGELSNCLDHTTGNGFMMLVNGAPAPDVNVWKQTVSVTPNTNYAFSTWVQALYPPNPAKLQFSINGSSLGNLITASLPTCTWTQFYTSWNSGNSSSAIISIVNKNTEIQGNDFALDDISFAPVFVKRDSILITVEQPVVKTNNDTTVCAGSLIQFNTTGASVYLWTPELGLSNYAIANPIIRVNNPVTYIVTGSTINGCMANDTVVISTLAKPLITLSNDTGICTNTSLQLLAAGGSSYSWMPTSTLDNPNISNPVATPFNTTVYYITATNASGCSDTDSIKVTVNSLPVIKTSGDTAICNNSSIELSASGGILYSWTPIASLNNPNISNPVATPANFTTYYVTVTNTSGCSNADSISINVYSLPVISTSGDTTICVNSPVQLSASGGSFYSWTPVSSLNNPNIANPVALAADTITYFVTVSNAFGCSNVDSVKINTKALPVTSISNDTAVCNNVQVQLFAKGGSTYIWTPSLTLNNSTIPNPIATPPSTTTYKVTVTNAAGCSSIDSVKVTSSPPPIISISNDTSICNNTSLQIFATGGSAYLWTSASSLSNSTINNPIVSPVTTTTYLVKVSTNTGCFKKDSIVISIHPKEIITISNDTAVCHTSKVQLIASGGSSYIWLPPQTLNNPNIPDPIASPVATTTYVVNITDGNSCKYLDSVTLIVKPSPVFSISMDTNICNKNSTRLLASGGDTYLWQPASFLSDESSNNPVAKPNTTTLYSVKIKSNTCNDSAFLSTLITVLPLPAITATRSNDIDCSNGFSQLNASGATQFSWSPSFTLNNSSIAGPRATPTTTTVYQVTGTGNNGCKNTDTVTVAVSLTNSSLYLMPNSFTPNNDGLNDCFAPKYWGTISEVEFYIYNRFGEKVYHTQDPGGCWDGKYKGEPQDGDVFVFIIKAKTACGTVNKKGSFVLLR